MDETITYEVTFFQTVDPESLETTGHPTDCIPGTMVESFECEGGEMADEIARGVVSPRATETWVYEVWANSTDAFENVLDSSDDVLSYKVRDHVV